MYFYTSLIIFYSKNTVLELIILIERVIQSRRLRWAGHVARIKEGRSAFKILTDKPTGKGDFFGGLGVDGSTIL